MVSDKWVRKGCDDPSVEHDIGSKVNKHFVLRIHFTDLTMMAHQMLPWKTTVVKDSEPASERLFRLHSRPLSAVHRPLPKLYVYHRSTWPREQQEQQHYIFQREVLLRTVSVVPRTALTNHHQEPAGLATNEESAQEQQQQ